MSRRKENILFTAENKKTGFQDEILAKAFFGFAFQKDAGRVISTHDGRTKEKEASHPESFDEPVISRFTYQGGFICHCRIANIFFNRRKIRPLEEKKAKCPVYLPLKKPQKTIGGCPGESCVNLKNPYNRLNIDGGPYIDTLLG